jgi:hypothetical protein
MPGKSIKAKINKETANRQFPGLTIKRQAFFFTPQAGEGLFGKRKKTEENFVILNSRL